MLAALWAVAAALSFLAVLVGPRASRPVVVLLVVNGCAFLALALLELLA